MNKLKTFIVGLILLANINQALAACQKPVSYLTEGASTPCSGYLYTEEYDLKIRQSLVELDHNKKLIGLYETQNDILMKRIKNLQEQNSIMDDKLATQEKTSYLTHIGAFLLGVGTVYLASQIVSNVK